MAYKSLLTIMTCTETTTLQAAASLAERMDAHLEVLCLGVDRTQAAYFYPGASGFVYQEALARAQEEAEAIEAAARSWLERQDLRWSLEAGVVQMGGFHGAVGLRARFSDLVVVSRPYGAEKALDLEAALEAALFAGQAPVLALPEGQLGPRFGERIVVGWNESAEAIVAVRRALPLLKKAEMVNIVVIDPPSHGPERSDPGGALCQLLARHGVRTEVSVLAKTMPRTADVLCRHVRDVDADLVVMGAYGHSRLRQAILGGATRNMLEIAEVPVFLAH